jgi:hypothetical protein
VCHLRFFIALSNRHWLSGYASDWFLAMHAPNQHYIPTTHHQHLPHSCITTIPLDLQHQYFYWSQLYTFLSKFLPITNRSVSVLSAFKIPVGWWTSGNYIVRSRRWMWTTKHHLMPIDFSRWAPGEPDARSTMHCMMMYRDAGYMWHDGLCTDKHNFICEIQLL